VSRVIKPLAVLLATLAHAGPGAMMTISPGSAHTGFVGSYPPDGAMLEDAPREVRLEFSEEMDPGLSAVTVQLDDDDPAALELRGGANPTTLVAVVPNSLRAAARGTTGWRTAFRIVSADGHPVAGAVDFVVRTGEGAGAVAAGPDETASDGAAGTTSPRAPDRREAWPLVVLGGGVQVLLALAVATVMRLVRRNPRK
jgi:methionine-rich copper-binding protein CopC